MLLLFLVTEVSLHYNYLDSLASSGIWRSLVGGETIVQNGQPIQLGAFGMGVMMFSAMLYYFFHVSIDSSPHPCDLNPFLAVAPCFVEILQMLVTSLWN